MHVPKAPGPEGETPALVLDDDLLQGAQLLRDFGPLEEVTLCLETPVEPLSEQRGEEGAELTPASCIIAVP